MRVGRVAQHITLKSGPESIVQPQHEIVASGLSQGDGGGAALCRRARVGKTQADPPMLRRDGWRHQCALHRCVCVSKASMSLRRVMRCGFRALGGAGWRDGRRCGRGGLGAAGAHQSNCCLVLRAQSAKTKK